jgi:hypothetical protein
MRQSDHETGRKRLKSFCSQLICSMALLVVFASLNHMFLPTTPTASLEAQL